MDGGPVQSAVPPADQDEWDSDGFVIPSLGIEEAYQIETNPIKVVDSKPSKVQAEKEEKIYLGPHGAPPSQGKPLVDQSSFGRKQKLKQKIREADRRHSDSGRENKVDSLRELVGSRKMPVTTKDSGKDWLDPHCHESQFERKQLY